MDDSAASPPEPRRSLRSEARELAHRLGRLLPVVQFLERDRLRPHGLTPTQWSALRAVAESDGLSVNRLAAELYLEKSTASRILAGLADRGLITREAQREDARAVRLAVTAAGRTLDAAVQADEERDYEALLARFTSADRARIQESLAALAKEMATEVESSAGRHRVVR
jgi:DNA-binding MarR family transcriptional regulator